MDSRKNIDKILNVKIVPSKYNNEFNALMQLRTGMELLYDNTKTYEIDIFQKNKEKKITFIGFPDNNDLIPYNISIVLPSYFHWFGNSLINYSRLTGYIIGRENGEILDEDIQFEPQRKKIKNYCDSYVKSIPELIEVLKWRNKVSAHFALTDPRNEDNIATMNSSIIFPINFINNRFRTTGGIYGITCENNLTFESEIPNWSITEVFEKLNDRFWSDIDFKFNNI